mmetsp:Transcript_6468/g.16431  ORF Transcript_6468/g.16431 Transcript_6468/m.16431 type:complete len:281 (-) Transcript_6468:1278-2120(-)
MLCIKSDARRRRAWRLFWREYASFTLRDVVPHDAADGSAVRARGILRVIRGPGYGHLGGFRYICGLAGRRVYFIFTLCAGVHLIGRIVRAAHEHALRQIAISSPSREPKSTRCSTQRPGDVRAGPGHGHRRELVGLSDPAGADGRRSPRRRLLRPVDCCHRDLHEDAVYFSDDAGAHRDAGAAPRASARHRELAARGAVKSGDDLRFLRLPRDAQPLQRHRGAFVVHGRHDPRSAAVLDGKSRKYATGGREETHRVVRRPVGGGRVLGQFMLATHERRPE